MKQLRLSNILAGWLIFVITSIVYFLTVNRTTGLWGSGELIATSYKLQVGHPPGSPLFLLVGRIFSLIAGEKAELVPFMVNSLSVVAGSFTILFLFWTISHFALKIVGKKKKYSSGEIISVIGSATVGSLCLAFSDTFWFSVVEGRTSTFLSLFTALMFWAILKWENHAHKKFANRWLILIAYLTGLSAGVHAFSLLAIPAVALIYYFKKYKATFRGVLLVSGISIAILLSLIYFIIPGFVKVASLFELMLVNGLSLPYWSGVIFYLALLFTGLAFGIVISHNRKKVILNSVFLTLTVIFIGYSSYATLIIRSIANPPIDSHNPENIFRLSSYIIGERQAAPPLILGQSFNSPILATEKKGVIYAPVNNRYEPVDKKLKRHYEKEFLTFLPRMWSNKISHIDAYLKWTGLNKDDFYNYAVDENGEPVKDGQGSIKYDYGSPKSSPSILSNLDFLFDYQANHMFFRYFMWNFSGRQNDFQAYFKDEINKGNWITGIGFLDSFRIGSQSELPHDLKENKARNKYFMLPFILGLIGMFFQFRNGNKDFWAILVFFFFNGIALVLYLNQSPLQSEESDFIFTRSFYAFSIWTGLSVLTFFRIASKGLNRPKKTYYIQALIPFAVVVLFDFVINKTPVISPTAFYAILVAYIYISGIIYLSSRIKSEKTIAIVSIIIALPIPLLMAFQNMDDHNRSNYNCVKNMAINYLNSCEENGILFTDNDNNTFPLRYAQEVEGIRTDVRVVNLNNLNSCWYIEQMEKQLNKSAPIPFSLEKEKYQFSDRKKVYLIERVNRAISLEEAIDFVAHDDKAYKSVPDIKGLIHYIPQNSFTIEANQDSVVKNKTIKPEVKKLFVQEMEFTVNKKYIAKNHLMVMDLLATNKWQRPIYYAVSVSDSNYLGLDSYFELAGLTYRIVPAKMKDSFCHFGGINTKLMYNRLMNDFQYGNIGDPEVFYDNGTREMLTKLRNTFVLTAAKMVSEGKKKKAVSLMDRCRELFPDDIFPYDNIMVKMAESYYKAGNKQSALDVLRQIHDNIETELNYYSRLKNRFKNYLNTEKKQALHALSEISKLTTEMGENELTSMCNSNLEKYAPILSTQQR